MMKLLPQYSNSWQYQLAALLSLALPFATAHAETLKDPTQPPAVFNGNFTSEAIATGPVLQSVMLGSNYKAAIINGNKVLLGQKYEQATLIKLNEHEAVLRYPDKTTVTLTMDYAIEKNLVKATTTVKQTTKLK